MTQPRRNAPMNEGKIWYFRGGRDLALFGWFLPESGNWREKSAERTDSGGAGVLYNNSARQPAGLNLICP